MFEQHDDHSYQDYAALHDPYHPHDKHWEPLSYHAPGMAEQLHTHLDQFEHFREPVRPHYDEHHTPHHYSEHQAPHHPYQHHGINHYEQDNLKPRY